MSRKILSNTVCTHDFASTRLALDVGESYLLDIKESKKFYFYNSLIDTVVTKTYADYLHDCNVDLHNINIIMYMTMYRSFGVSPPRIGLLSYKLRWAMQGSR